MIYPLDPHIYKDCLRAHSPDRPCRVAPVNSAFAAVRVERPQLWEELFHEDDFHPSALGSYLEGALDSAGMVCGRGVWEWCVGGWCVGMVCGHGVWAWCVGMVGGLGVWAWCVGMVWVGVVCGRGVWAWCVGMVWVGVVCGHGVWVGGVWAWCVGMVCGHGVWAWCVGMVCGRGVWA
jgi:hypothetical protein